MVRLDTDKVRPMDDRSPIRDLPKHSRPLACVRIYG